MAEKTLLGRLVQKKDTTTNWEGSTLPIKYGEIVLSYDKDSGVLTELRAGNSNQDTWTNLGSAIPAFTVSQIPLLRGLVDNLSAKTDSEYEADAKYAVTFTSQNGAPILTKLMETEAISCDESLEKNNGVLGVSNNIIWDCNENNENNE